MAFQNITLEKKEKIGWITINRPEALNVLSMATLLELESALDEIEKDEKVWVGVLTGSGEKAFCAGADLKEMGKLDAMWNMGYSKTCHRVFGKIEKMGKAFICGINGLAMGAGFEVAMACPLRIMSEKAFLTLPELGLAGLLALAWLLWTVFKHALRIYNGMDDDLYRGLALGFLAGFVGLAVHALTANTFIILRIRSKGRMEPLSRSSTAGANSFSLKSRTAFWTIKCASVNSNMFNLHFNHFISHLAFSM